MFGNRNAPTVLNIELHGVCSVKCYIIVYNYVCIEQ